MRGKVNWISQLLNYKFILSTRNILDEQRSRWSNWFLISYTFIFSRLITYTESIYEFGERHKKWTKPIRERNDNNGETSVGLRDALDLWKCFRTKERGFRRECETRVRNVVRCQRACRGTAVYKCQSFVNVRATKNVRHWEFGPVRGNKIMSPPSSQ